ncbi:MAG TPA: carboxypeptidase regulatory-like domain-containing protein [Miltoncostaeaceae bacterium]|nr:carboxypeptidase regulatory-like domain-containing protein [Miltoncostaeaceae bacterium]
MTPTPARSRLVVRSALLAGLLTLVASGSALGAVTGKVTNSAGVPVPGVSVRATEADGSFADSDTTDANGAYSLTFFGTPAPPFTLTATLYDGCRPSGSTDLSATAGPVNDGAVQNLTLDPFFFCSTAFAPSGQPEPSGNAWPERGQVLSPPGGVTYLRVLAPFSASNFVLTLQDGTPVGGGSDDNLLTLTAPASYNGPLNLTYTDGGAASTRTIATLVAGTVNNPNPPSGPTDLAAIVDISGSMGGTDPTFRRKDAVQLLVDLADQGDRLVGTGFDDQFQELFPRTTIAGVATKNQLKSLARKRIVNRGGTDYNVGLGAAFDALAADPLNPSTPKAAIFLTDGAHNAGTYNNVHLRFAFNGTGRAWPICVVRLGTAGFTQADVARLKRIASETGGPPVASTPTNNELENLYFQCRGRTSGATTVLKKTATFRVGQTKTFSRRITKNQRKATFFVSFGQGKYTIRAVQPGGKVFARNSGKNVRLVRGKTFSFIEVLKPKAGLWRVTVQRLPTGGKLDKATTTVTVQKKR